jgi:hypothetical protein
MVAFTGIGRVGFALILGLLAGCGGRTGTLDGQDIGTNSSLPSDEDTGGGGKSGGSSSSTGATSSTGASTSSGGKNSTGGGGQAATGNTSSGTAGAAQAGFPSAGGAPSQGGASAGGAAGSSVDSSCGSYCKYLASGPCPSQLTSYQECSDSCQQALEGNGALCEQAGLRMVDCLTRVLSDPKVDCAAVLTTAPLVCQKELLAYQSCSEGAGPGPVPPPDSCAGGGSASPTQCTQNVQCSGGTFYSALCNSMGNISYCTCSTNGGNAKLTLNESSQYACTDALAACGAPIISK